MRANLISVIPRTLTKATKFVHVHHVPAVSKHLQPSYSTGIFQKSLFFPRWNGCQLSMRYQAYAKPSKGAGGGKKLTGKKAFDDILDGLDSDDEDLDEVSKKMEHSEVLLQDTPASRFISGKIGGAKGGKKDHKVEKTKNKGGHISTVSYAETKVLLNVDMYWQEMEDVCKAQQEYFIHQLTLRSAAALDDLPVELEGDTYPLREIADISKKDPKKVVIDTSAFPQATSSIMKTLVKNSGLNLNPQQDGTRIYVPIPKVSREHRDILSKGARTKCNETKELLRKVQTKYMKQLGDKELAGNISVPKNHFVAVHDILLSITEHFISEAEAMTQKKQKDLIA